jgi:hypothetical protein
MTAKRKMLIMMRSKMRMNCKTMKNLTPKIIKIRKIKIIRKEKRIIIKIKRKRKKEIQKNLPNSS